MRQRQLLRMGTLSRKESVAFARPRNSRFYLGRVEQQGITGEQCVKRFTNAWDAYADAQSRAVWRRFWWIVSKHGKYSYCGPFTKLNKRLTEGYRGVNLLDRACFDHDVAYAAHKDTASRNNTDDVLVAAASKIALSDDAPEYEKKYAGTVAATMSVKSRLGVGVGRGKR